MINLQSEQIDDKDLIPKRHNESVISDFDLLDVRFEAQICYNFLRFWLMYFLLSSKMATLFAGAKGV